MNPNFVSNLYASKRAIRDTSIEPPSDKISVDDYHEKIRQSLYVRLVGKNVLYKRLVEEYGPLFLKVKDDIKLDKKGKVKSHRILVKQVCNVRYGEGDKPWIRVPKPWQNWIDLKTRGLEVNLYKGKKEGFVIKLPNVAS